MEVVASHADLYDKTIHVVDAASGTLIGSTSSHVTSQPHIFTDSLLDMPVDSTRDLSNNNQRVMMRQFHIPGREWKLFVVYELESLSLQGSPLIPVLLWLFTCVLVVAMYWLYEYRSVGLLLELDQLPNDDHQRALAYLCHEIRNPLHCLSHILDDIIDASEQSSETVDNANLIKGIVGHMVDLVNGFLDFSKLTGGSVGLNLSPRPTSIVVFIRELHAQYKVLAPNEVDFRLNIEQDIDNDDLMLNVDPVRLRQILSNGYSNATKFTKSGSVTLIVRVGRSNIPMLVFSILDTGAGLGDSDPEFLFKPYTQGDNQRSADASSFGTTGLGLTLSRELADLMGGTLRLSNRKDGQLGAKYELRIPFKPLRKVDENNNTTTTTTNGPNELLSLSRKNSNLISVNSDTSSTLSSPAPITIKRKTMSSSQVVSLWEID